MTTVTLTPLNVLLCMYVVGGLLLLAAGYMEQSQFTNPKYHEVLLIAVIWPIWILQYPYYWITGRYLYADCQRLVGDGNQ